MINALVWCVHISHDDNMAETKPRIGVVLLTFVIRHFFGNNITRVSKLCHTEDQNYMGFLATISKVIWGEIVQQIDVELF